MTREEKLREIGRLLKRVHQLENEIAHDVPHDNWPPPYYTTYQVMSGCVFGMFGAAVSLIVNVIGSLMFQQHPLQLIRVYLTFPLGETAMTTQSDVALAIGCCLYLATGMILGVPFQLMLSRWFGHDKPRTRFLAVTALSLGLWLFNYYVVLSWLQPLLFGGNWIVASVPWWVAALTHLVFGWTILLAQPLSVFRQYRPLSEAT